MTLAIRRLIYIIFILIFLIAAPVILLYTTGYNYNFKKGALLETGVLLLDALPADAQFNLDGQPMTEKLPARISNLKPKDYTAEIKKDGFNSWKKTLSVGSGETVYATNIFLPKIDLPRLLSSKKIEQAIYLEESNQFIFVTETGGQTMVVRFDANAQKTSTLYTLKRSEPITLTISPNERYLAIESKTLAAIINLSKLGKPLLLIGKNGPLAELVFEESNDFVIYGKDSDTIVRYNLITNKRDNLTVLKTNHFLIWGEFIYWTNDLADQPFALRRLALSGAHPKIETIVSIPKGDWRLFSLNDHIILREKQTNNFILLDWKTLKKISDGHLTDFGLPKKGSFIYWDASEIWLQNLNQEAQSALLLRLGQPIVKAMLLNKYPYTLFATSDTLSLAEEDDRDIKNIYSLAGLQTINDFFIKNDKQVYIIGKQKDGQEGLFELDLQ